MNFANSSIASPENSIETDNSSSKIFTLNEGYLEGPPYFPDNEYKVTKIFLENATLYDFTTASSKIDFNSELPEDYYLFFANGSIINEYSSEEITKSSKEGNSYCLIGLDIYLYDAEGNEINTIHSGNPFRGCYQSSLRSGERGIFKVAFITSVPAEKFEIYINYLDPLPQF